MVKMSKIFEKLEKIEIAKRFSATFKNDIYFHGSSKQDKTRKNGKTLKL